MSKSEKLFKDLLAEQGETEVDVFYEKCETKRRAVVDSAVEEVFAARLAFWTCPGGYQLKELSKMALIQAECHLLQCLNLQCTEPFSQSIFTEAEGKIMYALGATRED
jgi:hypothetical protein